MGGRALRTGARGLAAPFLPILIRPARLPARLLIAPQDIRVADATIADDVYAGHFALAGRVVNGHGKTPFEIEPPSRAWAEALHGFAWLRHLRAADTALARANGRALVDDWIAAVPIEARAPAWRPGIVARRLLSWLSQSPVILEGADVQFYRRLMKSMMQQTAFLQRCLMSGLVGDDRLWAALALVEVSLCVDKTAPSRRASHLFLQELDIQVLPDGGHISRDPQVIVDLLLDLLPLRQAYAARGAEVPPALLNAIDRMMPMLRLFRHADGSLALFNGMSVTHPEALATILAYDDARAMPQTNAPYSGYQRLAASESVLICDTGPPPPIAFSLRAHAGTLSFEFSTDGQPMIVNCGHPEPGDRAMTAAARSTAAHSALILADRSSSHFQRLSRRASTSDEVIASGPREVPVTRPASPGAATIEASHDGYAALGFVHRRRLSLSDDGTVLSGEDEVLPVAADGPGAGLPVAIRFHLHPLARAAYADDGFGVLIALGSGAMWRFEAEGHDIDIEESIYFGSAEGARRSEQIVVQASAPDTTIVRWLFAASAGD